MSDRETVMSLLEDLSKDDWVLRFNDNDVKELAKAVLELLKEQETANLYKCPNCGTWVSAENVVRCKYCKFRGNTNLCPLAYIEKAEQFTALCTDEWFCGNGKRKEGGELNGQGEGNELA